jgi:prephenate dehydrogenase
MGGSLAMGLRGKCKTLLGLDPDSRTLALARQQEVVDMASSEPEEVLPGADIIVLAAPVLAIIEWIRVLPDLMPEPAVVMDLGSTKTQICQAMGKLPPRFDPIGGHPMAGKETSGLGNAEQGLYHGAVFALTPLQRTSQRAKDLAEKIVLTIGARPLWLDVVVHDQWVAATSQLPYLLSSALTLATPEETSPLVGPGFRGNSRLAGSDTRMMTDILVTNRDAVLDAMDRFRREFDQMENELRYGSNRSLQANLERGKTQRDRLFRSVEESGA